MLRTVVAAIALLSPTASFAAEKISYDTIGCVKEADFDRATELGISGDKDAWVAFLTQKIQRGQCAMLQKGDEVFLEDFGLLSGKSCVRPRGETVCVYVESEALMKEGG